MKNSRSAFVFILPALLFMFRFAFPAENGIRTLTLDRCLEIALQNNSDLKLAAESIRDERAKLEQVEAQRLPQIQFEGSYLRFSEVMEATIAPEFTGLPVQMTPLNLRFGDEDNYTASLHITQPVFTGFRLRNSVEAARDRFKAAQYEEQQAINDLCFQVKKNYYTLANAQQFKQAALLSQRSIEAHLHDVKNLFDQGMLNETEVLQVEIKKSEVELMIHQADNKIKVLKKTLMHLLGMDLDTDFSLETGRIAAQPPIHGSGAHETANGRRAELLQLDHRKKALQHGLGIAKAGYYPSIVLIGRYEYGKPGLNKLENEWMDYWTIGISAKWSLWDWGVRKSKYQQSQVALNRIETVRKMVETTIQLDVEKTRLYRDEAARRLTLARRTTALAQQKFKLVRDQFQQGLVTNTDFLDAETQQTRAKIAELQAIADYKIAAADFDRALGLSTFPGE
jgi:outer membrane protein TolC